MRVLSGDHVTSLSIAFENVIFLALALPSAGTIQRSLDCSFGSYDGSVTEKTTHRPSGLIAGAPTRFISQSVSCVIGCFAAIAAAATRTVATNVVNRFIKVLSFGYEAASPA